MNQSSQASALHLKPTISARMARQLQRVLTNSLWFCLLRGGLVALVIQTFMPVALAQPTCTDLQASLIPATTSVTMTPAAGTVWSGVLRVIAIGCNNGSYNTIRYIIVPGGTTPQATTITGISIAPNGPATGSTTSGGCPLYSSGILAKANGVYFGAQNLTCNFQVDFPIKFTKTAGVIAGTITSTQLAAGFTQGVSTITGWVAVNNKQGGPIQNGYTSATVSVAPTLTFSTLTCTVSPSTVNVFLPTASKAALASAGAVAGRTPFTVTLTGCPAAASTYSAVATWSFSPAFSSTVIGNSAPLATRAANVGIQLLDANLAPLTNGGTSTMVSTTAGGNFSSTFYAQYYATGVGGAGDVVGQATFTLTYQ